MSLNHEKDYEVIEKIEETIKMIPRVELNIDVFNSYENEIQILQQKNLLLENLLEFYEDTETQNHFLQDPREHIISIMSILQQSEQKSVRNLLKVQLPTI